MSDLEQQQQQHTVRQGLKGMVSAPQLLRLLLSMLRRAQCPFSSNDLRAWSLYYLLLHNIKWQKAFFIPKSYMFQSGVNRDSFLLLWQQHLEFKVFPLKLHEMWNQELC